MDRTFSFDPHALSIAEVARRTADMWADLPWDKEELARLKRDGLVLDGLNLGGACPYLLAEGEAGRVIVSVIAADQIDRWLDLWRLHFLRGLRHRPLA